MSNRQSRKFLDAADRIGVRPIDAVQGVEITPREIQTRRVDAALTTRRGTPTIPLLAQ